MTEASSNDNRAPAAEGKLRGPDAHGQAAILLTESLIHGLIAKSLISVDDALEIVGVASDIKREVADEEGDSPANMEKSLTILRAIEKSLSTDFRDGREDA